MWCGSSAACSASAATRRPRRRRTPWPPPQRSCSAPAAQAASTRRAELSTYLAYASIAHTFIVKLSSSSLLDRKLGGKFLPSHNRSGCPLPSIERNNICLFSPELPLRSSQAMMELGAVVCTQQPACGTCPIRAACGAYGAVQEHVAAGGSAATAPPVTQYPAKVRARASPPQSLL